MAREGRRSRERAAWAGAVRGAPGAGGGRQVGGGRAGPSPPQRPPHRDPGAESGARGGGGVRRARHVSAAAQSHVRAARAAFEASGPGRGGGRAASAPHPHSPSGGAARAACTAGGMSRGWGCPEGPGVLREGVSWERGAAGLPAASFPPLPPSPRRRRPGRVRCGPAPSSCRLPGPCPPPRPLPFHRARRLPSPGLAPAPRAAPAPCRAGPAEGPWGG